MKLFEHRWLCSRSLEPFGTVAVLVVALACQPPPGEIAATAPPVPASGQLGLVRSVSWPGGGRELTIRVQSQDGDSAMGDLSAEFSLSLDGIDAAEIDVQVTLAPLSPGYTAILVAPAASVGDRVALVADLKAFVSSRPDSEYIALYAWQRQVDQVSSFTRDRARLDRMLDLFLDIAPSNAPQLPSGALIAVETEALSIAGKAPRGMRAVVVAGGAELTVGPTAVPVLVGLDSASAHIDEFAATSFYRVAVCGPTSGVTGTLSVAGLSGVLPIVLPATLPEEVDANCDPGNIGPGLRSYPKRIELLFDADQRAVYDQRVGDLSKADFALSVRLGLDTEPIVASAHLRGRGTLGCVRKSYTVTLDGPGRHLLPESRTDEFYLLSMCADDRYVQQFTANQLMKELGLFPMEFGYVEVAVDGQTSGVYLLLEKTREELVRDNARVRTVMRRRFVPPDDTLEVKYTSATDEDAIASYEIVLEDIASAGDLVDLDQYLRFLALMTAYENGDYVDEIWLTSTEHMVTDGTMTDWFQMMGWDNDDLFSECHYQGNYAFVDDNQLIYCAEARLDKALLADSSGYDRYVNALDELLGELVTPERFDDAIEHTATEVMPFFADADICAAMTRLIAANPAAVDPGEAQRDVRAVLDNLKALYRARHAVLLGRIQAYRGAQ